MMCFGVTWKSYHVEHVLPGNKAIKFHSIDDADSNFSHL